MPPFWMKKKHRCYLFTVETRSIIFNINVLYFLYGWIAGSWEAHFRNYRHFVSQYPVSTLDWLPNFPHKAWIDPRRFIRFSLAKAIKWIAVSRNQTALACVAIEVHDHYTKTPCYQITKKDKQIISFPEYFF